MNFSESLTSYNGLEVSDFRQLFLENFFYALWGHVLFYKDKLKVYLGLMPEEI